MTYNIAVHFISLKSKFLKICAWFLLYRMLQLRLANIHVNLESERNVVICMIQPVLKLLFLGKWIKIIDGGLDIQIFEFIIPERILYVIFKGLGVWNLLKNLYYVVVNNTYFKQDCSLSGLVWEFFQGYKNSFPLNSEPKRFHLDFHYI